MDLRQIRDTYIDDGLDFQSATARTCRDVVLTLISASRMAAHVTVKGGVVMQQISGDRRRATSDLDLDFVLYPMTDEAIHRFIRVLCPADADDMRENSPAAAHARLSRVLNDRRFRRNLSNARNNWLGANVDKVVSGILRHFE